ncbi:L,D-transpeptidase [Candidatus Saccharibacteria bacterium]|nr:L,D-transpeptidase [Candidatus Saccharibacteria bacterium]
MLTLTFSSTIYAEESPPIDPAVAAEIAAQAQAQAEAIAVIQAAQAIQTAQAVQAMQATIPGPPASIIVHRISNTCQVYDANGQLLNNFIVSTGRTGHLTPLGTHKIYEHSTGTGYHLMVDGTYGRFCMRFKKGGYMFHSVCYAYPGAPEPIPEEVFALGTSVSRGCIRLSVTDAQWLYDNTPNGCLVSVLDD